MSMTAPVATHEADPRAPRRVRHEPRRRMLIVKNVEKIAAHIAGFSLAALYASPSRTSVKSARVFRTRALSPAK